MVQGLPVPIKLLGKMIEWNGTLSCADQCTLMSQDDVDFGHEHVQLHIFAVPPLSPLLRVVGRDGDVADARVEPHIEHLRNAE